MPIIAELQGESLNFTQNNANIVNYIMGLIFKLYRLLIIKTMISLEVSFVLKSLHFRKKVFNWIPEFIRYKRHKPLILTFFLHKFDKLADF